MKPLFPFTIFALETTHYTMSAHGFRGAFLAAKPKDLTWYAYDVIVKSRTEVEFTVYSMRDNCYGGIGEKIATFEAVVDPSLTAGPIENEALRRGHEKRAEELMAIERRMVRRYADELLATLD